VCRMEIGHAIAESVTGFIKRGPDFEPNIEHVGFFIAGVTQGQGFLRVIQLSPVSSIPPLFRTDTYWSSTLSSRGSASVAE
jgi:hypothetical protein